MLAPDVQLLTALCTASPCARLQSREVPHPTQVPPLSVSSRRRQNGMMTLPLRVVHQSTCNDQLWWRFNLKILTEGLGRRRQLAVEPGAVESSSNRSRDCTKHGCQDFRCQRRRTACLKVAQDFWTGFLPTLDSHATRVHAACLRV